MMFNSRDDTLNRLRKLVSRLTGSVDLSELLKILRVSDTEFYDLLLEVEGLYVDLGKKTVYFENNSNSDTTQAIDELLSSYNPSGGKFSDNMTEDDAGKKAKKDDSPVETNDENTKISKLVRGSDRSDATIPTEIRYYNNTPLDRSDHDFLLLLERQLNVENITHIEHEEDCDFGFMMDSGRIITLGVNKMKLMSIPYTIGNLSGLRHLRAEENRLRDLPIDFADLKSLTYLEIRDNDFSEIPALLGQLPELTHLDIANNNLTGLPKNFGDCVALLSLNLFNNQISSLPSSFHFPPNLEYLNLGMNGVRRIPSSIGELRNLRKLILSSNSLTTLPKCLLKLERLEEFYLLNNKFRFFPEIAENIQANGCKVFL